MKRLCSILLTLALLIGIAPVETLLAEETYTVTYLDNDGTTVLQTHEVQSGENVPAFEGLPEKEGYAFKAWNNIYKNGEQTSLIVDEDMEFKAFWTSLPEDLTENDAMDHGVVKAVDEFHNTGSFNLNVNLIEGTFDINETYYDTEKEKLVASVTINDVEPYRQALQDAYVAYYSDGQNYVYNDGKTPDENLTIHFQRSAQFSKSGSIYQLTFATWTLDTDYYQDAQRSELYFTRTFPVKLVDGDEESTLSIKETSSNTYSFEELSDPTRGGYKFLGWNTQEDGNGATYTSADTLEYEASDEQFELTLYAQWKIIIANTLQYDANGGEGGPINNFTNGQNITVQTKEPTREGYLFDGWNTEADGSGQTYKAGDTILIDPDNVGGQKLVLYAQWKVDTPPTVKIGDYVTQDGETVYIDKDADGINIYAYDDNGIHFWYRGSDQPNWQSGNWLPFDNDNWDGKPSELRVYDDAGNTTTVYFMFDRTLPVISGVEDGKTYEGSVSPIISDNSGNVSSTLDGEAYDGSTIAKEGTHTLVATDGSGNTVTVTFTIKAKEEVKSSTPSISCAGEKDKNCDGVITCDEEKGEGWTWNNAKGVCEYTGTYTVVSTGVK